MNRTFENEQQMADAIGNLPGSIRPESDLWPGIAQRLDGRELQQARGSFVWRRHAIAASVLVAFAVGIILGRQTSVEPVGAPPQMVSATQVAMRGVVEASEREYQAAFQVYAPVGVRAAYLETGAVQGIEGSWADLQQAEAALMTALEEHPENHFLNEKLLDLRARQLEFMRQIYMLDQNSRRKT